MSCRFKYEVIYDDTIIVSWLPSGMYLVERNGYPYGSFTCCKSVALSYIRKCQRKKDPQVTPTMHSLKRDCNRYSRLSDIAIGVIVILLIWASIHLLFDLFNSIF